MITISSFITLSLILFAIRFGSFLISFPSNFDNLWHVGEQSLFPGWTSIALAVIAIIVILQFTSRLKSATEKTKTAYHIYIAITYILLTLFSRDVSNTFSYQYILQAYKTNTELLTTMIQQDLFFESPYSFWWLLFMVGAILFSKKKKILEYSIPLWILPFSFINYCKLNDISQCLMLASLAIASLGLKYSKGRSSLPYLLIQFIVSISITTFISTIPSKAYSFKYLCQIFAMFYIPAFILVFSCLREKNPKDSATTWIVPSFINFCLLLPLFRLPTQYCFINVLTFLTTFSFTGKIALIASFITLISYLLSKFSEKSGKIVFISLSALISSAYILDSLLFYYSNFRLDYSTLRWTAAMGDAFSTTFKTCMTYLSGKALLITLFAIILLIILAMRSKKILRNESSFRFTFLMLLISSHIVSSGLTFSDVIPIILRDPAVEFAKTVPITIIKNNSIDINTIKEGFKSCYLPLKEYPDSPNPTKGNQQNLILVTLESVHWKYLNLLSESESTTPELSKLKDRMEIFPYFFSVFPESTCADFSVVTGLQAPNHLYIEEKSLFTFPTIANELKKRNYNNYFFCSENPVDGNLISIIKAMPFDYSFYYNLSDIKASVDSWTWGYKEESMVKEIINFLKENNNSNPYFLWYRTVYPHAPFEIFPSEQKRFFANAENEIVSSYLNNLLYLDKQLANLVRGIDELDKNKARKTIIAFVADHGEMLEEKENRGMKGHGTLATAHLTNVPFIIINPQKSEPIINHNYGSQIDVFPTLLAKLELNHSINSFGQGSSLLSDVASKPIYLSSMNSIALVENGYYFDFVNKNSPNANISKLSLDSNYKVKFQKITSWEGKDLYEKFTRTKKYFELNKQIMEK